MIQTPSFYAIALILVTGITHAYAGENASNPLASVNNTDLRWQYLDLDGPRLNDFYADGSYMLHPKLKLKYELHYQETDVTGRSKSDWESLHIKPIYFPKQGQMGAYKYKLAVGAEWIVDFRNDDQGIGSGSDLIAAFVGTALVRGNTVMIPLLQHFVDYAGGTDVNLTSLRLIAIQSLPHNLWGKLDLKVPVNWEDDQSIPANAEVQLGKMFNPSFGIYVDGLIGLGSDRPYDWGVGVGLRFNY